MQGDVRSLARGRQEEAVRRSPGPALVQAEEDETRLRLLPREAIEAGGVAVRAERDCRLRRDGGQRRDEDEGQDAEPKAS